MAAVLTDAGRAILAARLKGTGTEPNTQAWGTGAGTAAAADTALFTEASEARVTGTSSVVTTSVTGDTYQVVATLVADAPKTITNAGLFDGAGGMFLHADFAGEALAAGEALQFTWQIRFA